MAAGNRKTPTRAKSSDSRYSLMEFIKDFPDDEACLRWLWQTSYAADDEGKTAHCMKCGEVRTFTRYSTTQQRQSWTCTACGTHVHPTAGTIFHKSSTSLHLWFYAIYLISSTRCGISAKQLEREIGVTYKTAWRMFTLIRNELMAQSDDKLSGDVEADETYVGGRPRLKHIPRTPTGKIYVAGDVHTQTIEGFWSLLKRGLSGTHHAVSAKYLQGYLNEYAWRYNHRDDDRAMFLSLILNAARV